MARYMNAQILEGEDGGFPLVSKAMFRELHTERYRNTPISMGFAHAFWTTELNGSQAIEHGGGTPNFQNVMTMIPGKRFGFYVSAMSGGLAPWASYSDDEIKAGKLAVRDAMLGYELRESFIDRFLKRTADFNVEAAARAPRVDLSAYAGTYWTQKRDFTTVEALLGAFNPAAVLTVTLSDDGKGLLLNGAGPYTQVANGVFASKTAGNVWIDPYTMDMFQPAHIGFDIDAAGNVRGMVPGLVEPQMWVPASPIFNPLVMRLIAGICGLVAVTGALLFLWPQASRCRQPANYVALLAAAAVTAMPLAVMAGFERGDSLLDQVLIGEFGRLWILIGATNALLAAGIVLAILAVRAWRRAQSATTPKWALLGYRTHLSLVALAAIGGALALGFFNLLGVHIRG
jgi:hypothetical protein